MVIFRIQYISDMHTRYEGVSVFHDDERSVINTTYLTKQNK